MRRIGIIPEQRHASRFADYLLTQGVHTKIEEASGGWAIWAMEEDRLDWAKEALVHYGENSDDTRYTIATSEAQKLRELTARKEREYRKNVVNMGQGRWKSGSFTTAGRPLTIALIAAAAGISMATGTLSEIGQGPLYRHLLFADPAYPPWSQILHGQVWRLVTPIFLHFSFLHLLFNGYMLYRFGSLLERKFGTAWLAVFVAVAAVLSNAAQYEAALLIYQRGLFAGQFGGLSGVVYAMFGFIWIRGQVDFSSGLLLHPTTVLILLGFLVICYTGLIGRNIANEAHLAGLIVGMAWGGYPELIKR